KADTGTTKDKSEPAAQDQPEATAQQSIAVQAISPKQQSPQGKPQQKKDAKSDLKSIDTTEVNSTPTPILSQAQPSPKSDAPNSAETSAPTASSVIQPDAMGLKKPVIKPQSPQLSQAQSANASNASSDPSQTSDASTATAAVQAADLQVDAEAVSDNSAADSAAPTKAEPTRTLTQSAALNALSNSPTLHAPDPASSTTPTTPTRAFAEANQDQIVTTIKGQLLPNGGTMQITLHPANLGHVHISVEVSAGTVSATFETSTDQATRLLSHSLGQLKQTLESAGVNVDKLQVQQTRSAQPQSHNEPQQQSQQQQQSATDQRSAQQEQQRQEILQQMWDKIAASRDWIDVTA
ncbi:MAG TPA: flagellar hook-length control protein FliK, partial [Tepidisphaeraceae bacterium]|nr:flagellar hook-length control protein FliK [Tepidisphaeraceae bacterium]